MVIRVRDIMSKPAYTIDLDKTAQDAAKIMKKTRVGCLIVTKHGKPVGIVTDSDLIKRVVAANIRASSVKIRKMMSAPLIGIGPNEPILAAARKMKKNRIHRLPVIKDGKIKGLVSLSDIAITSPEMLDLLEHRLKWKAMPPPEIIEEPAYGLCDSCGDLSSDLRLVADRWLCESCRDELGIEG